MEIDNRKLCELGVKTFATCLSEGKCVPEIVNHSNGKVYLRSPKAKKDITKLLKKKISDFLCKIN